jgi:formylglycine-generating enzyme required for sulfatase activity
MVFVPAGKFMMGTPAGEAGRDKDEAQHAVTISSRLLQNPFRPRGILPRSV